MAAQLPRAMVGALLVPFCCFPIRGMFVFGFSLTETKYNLVFFNVRFSLCSLVYTHFGVAPQNS